MSELNQKLSKTHRKLCGSFQDGALSLDVREQRSVINLAESVLGDHGRHRADSTTWCLTDNRAGRHDARPREPPYSSGLDYDFTNVALVKSGFGGEHTDSNQRLM